MEKQPNGGVSTGSKEMKQQNQKKNNKNFRKNVELSQVYGVGTGAQSVDGRIGDVGGGGRDSSNNNGYMGLGRDGVWISKKNFVKS